MKSEELEVVNNSRTVYAEVGKANNAIINTCENSYTLKATSATDFGSDYEGTWTVSGGTIDDEYIHDPSATVTNIASNGFATLTWTVKNSNGDCPAVSTITVRNNYVKASASQNGSVCDGVAELIASYDNNNSNLSGEWSVVSGDNTKFVGNRSQSTITYKMDDVPELGSVIFRWTLTNKVLDGTDENGQPVYKTCTDPYDFTVTNDKYTTFTVGEGGLAGCEDGNTFQLNAEPLIEGATGYWTVVPSTVEFESSNPAKYENGSNDPKAKAINLSTSVDNQFVWNVKYKNCPVVSSDAIVVKNHAVPTPKITSEFDGVICSETITLSAEKPSAPAQGYWSDAVVDWYANGAVANYAAASSLASVTVGNLPKNQTTTFTWNVKNEECVLSTTVDVTNKNYNAVINSPKDKITNICGDQIKLQGQAIAGVPGRWSWDDENVTVVEGDPASDATITVKGITSASTTFKWIVGKEGELCGERVASVTVKNIQVASNAGNDMIDARRRHPRC